eukprot:CAMPEP_0175935552 /NCGR_PEP_ID=MMETSP0108-20121206/21101_1 /TAXON_ID=195067 ORGANISM="Goniomonas pacifica, Strain CCMP1869" /NCGR_SAMPLE_ID=MMETSP0108 /ASSEMBLY_ACC=CAM_ASM_000204 /LENGTH=44 /DNA_ID= /DNA_START= /DNA_END= /DNA_ORIENTATION=
MRQTTAPQRVTHARHTRRVRQGQTPLFASAFNGHVEASQMLVGA